MFDPYEHALTVTAREEECAHRPDMLSRPAGPDPLLASGGEHGAQVSLSYELCALEHLTCPVPHDEPSRRIDGRERVGRLSFAARVTHEDERVTERDRLQDPNNRTTRSHPVLRTPLS